jgi:hypothetical protein
VLRFRLGGSYRVNDVFEIGARLVTGDANNPRTADVTIGDFVHDLELSLDRAYVEMHRQSVFATAGKFRNPFTSTELVWDGDVNPAGAAARLDLGGVGMGVSATVNGMFMIVDEISTASDSTMWGAQLGLATAEGGNVGLQVSAAYWDYRIATLGPVGGAGDPRGNYLTADGSAYLSDFNLADLTVAIRLPGPTADYPLRLVADLATNVGAAVDQDQAFGVDVFVGSPWAKGRFDFRYGYAQCETDAVLGTFSHDNIPFATNYRYHVLRVSYGVLDDTDVSFTWYVFTRLDEDVRHPEQIPGDYRSRVRLDLMLRF